MSEYNKTSEETPFITHDISVTNFSSNTSENFPYNLEDFYNQGRFSESFKGPPDNHDSNFYLQNYIPKSSNVPNLESGYYSYLHGLQWMTDCLKEQESSCSQFQNNTYQAALTTNNDSYGDHCSQFRSDGSPSYNREEGRCQQSYLGRYNPISFMEGNEQPVHSSENIAGNFEKASPHFHSNFPNNNSSNGRNYPVCWLHQRTDAHTKPPFSYITLIVSAMNSKNSKQITLSEIYNWITSNFAYYRRNTKRWQNSIRHALSFNDCFVKVPRPTGEAGKGSYWTVHPDAMDMFESGSSMRRNRKFVDEHRHRNLSSTNFKPLLNSCGKAVEDEQNLEQTSETFENCRREYAMALDSGEPPRKNQRVLEFLTNQNRNDFTQNCFQNSQDSQFSNNCTDYSSVLFEHSKIELDSERTQERSLVSPEPESNKQSLINAILADRRSLDEEGYTKIPLELASKLSPKNQECTEDPLHRYTHILHQLNNQSSLILKQNDFSNTDSFLMAQRSITNTPWIQSNNIQNSFRNFSQTHTLNLNENFSAWTTTETLENNFKLS